MEAPFAVVSWTTGKLLFRSLPATRREARGIAAHYAKNHGPGVVLLWGNLAPEFVDDEGHTSNVYNHNNLAGCVAQWKSRETGTLVGLYHGVQSGMESDPDTVWCVVCEVHGTLVGHPTLTEARRTRSPKEFCDDCRDHAPQD